jgi:hypothetical protein
VGKKLDERHWWAIKFDQGGLATDRPEKPLLFSHKRTATIHSKGFIAPCKVVRVRVTVEEV